MNINKNLRQIANAAFERQRVLEDVHQKLFEIAAGALRGTAVDHRNALIGICKIINPKYEVPLDVAGMDRVQKGLGLVKNKAAPEDKAKPEKKGEERAEQGRLKPGTHVRQV